MAKVWFDLDGGNCHIETDPDEVAIAENAGYLTEEIDQDLFDRLVAAEAAYRAVKREVLGWK